MTSERVPPYLISNSFAICLMSTRGNKDRSDLDDRFEVPYAKVSSEAYE